MMDIEAQWDRARKGTEIIRMRMKELSTFEATAVPYVFLAESSVNRGDTVIRRGQVLIERPAILLPGLSPQFEGFAFNEDLHLSNEALTTFLLIRGVQFPSLRYRHEVSSLDLLETALPRAVDQVTRQLTMAEDISTGLVTGPEDVWQLSVVLLTGALVIRAAQGDIRRLLDDYRRRRGRDP